MTNGIRTVRSLTFTVSALLAGCGHAPDPAQLTAVDQLITATDAAVLTLNELDRSRYQRTDSLFKWERSGFDKHFTDTLDRKTAGILGTQYIVLRAAHIMGQDHERVLAELGGDGERLRALRGDLANGAIAPKSAESLIVEEQRQHTGAITRVHAVIDNYRLLQHAWDRDDSVTTLLADTNLPGRP